MLKRAIGLDHVVSNLEMMQSETSTWNVMLAKQKEAYEEIEAHAKEHGYEMVPGSLHQVWLLKTEPSDMFCLKTMATMQKEEVDTGFAAS